MLLITFCESSCLISCLLKPASNKWLYVQLMVNPNCQAFLLFGDEEYLFMFQEAYGAAMHYLFNDPW